jgi:Tfp pilus assembly protein PilO
MNRFYLLKSIPLVIIISFALVLILGGLILWPRFQDLRLLNRQIGEMQAQLQSQENYFSKLNDTKAEFKTYELELSKIDSALPDDPSLPSLLNFIQKACSQSGLVLKSISPFASSALEEKTQLQASQTSIQVSGPYSVFKNFLATLENSARLIEVENIAFSSPQEENIINFNLKIKVTSY